MSTFDTPLRFSRAFDVDPKRLSRLGAFDPVLATDTHLFIDPMSLRHSRISEIRDNAHGRLIAFYEKMLRLLRQSQGYRDTWAKTAFDHWPRRELGGTCLGYGGGSIRGTAASAERIRSTLDRASDIVRGGVQDPELFSLIGLFEPGIGSDTISDLVTNLILPDLAAFTVRVCTKLDVKTEEFRIGGEKYQLPRNPTQKRSTPIILVPKDVLRELPIALSYSEIWDVARQNAELRNAMNNEISSTWEKTTKGQKQDILEKLLTSADSVQNLIAAMKSARPPTYDLRRDPKGMLIWADLAYELGEQFPHKIAKPPVSLLGLNAVVEQIIEQFKTLMEKRDLWKVMQLVPSRQLEKVAQTLFFATAYAYVKSNNIDITPEADTGNGPVDFKFSTGMKSRVLVELKLSKNNVVKGYTTQLPTYTAAEEAKQAHYLVVDVGGMGNKWALLQDVHRARPTDVTPCKIWLVDATRKASASKREKNG